MKRSDGHFPQYFPEAAEHAFEYELNVPKWDRLSLQAEVYRAVLLDREAQGLENRDIMMDVPDRRKFGTVVSPFPSQWFDLRNIFCFQHLPDIMHIKDAADQQIEQIGRDGGVPIREIRAMQEQTRAELAHSIYHHAMWRFHGRHVYVLDRTTYQLLADTPLPDLPASILSAPLHSFYLALPPEAFEFGVWNRSTHTIDRQPIEGVFVSLDNIEAGSTRQRELAFMPVGMGTRVTDRNIAFFSIALGPDASLREITMPFSKEYPVPMLPGMPDFAVAHREAREMEEWGAGKNGGYELGVVIPRVLVSLLLYLASEHPDIEPVAPAPRQKFSDIRSPKQRAAALANQATKLKGATKLPILYVGGHLHEEIEAERERVQRAIVADGGRTWSLDHPVWVKGHWRDQPYGQGRALRRVIWIRPYQKGPDMAASMTVQAAKVQRAQHVSQ